MRPLAPGFLASGSLLALTACSPVETENQSPTLSILEPAYAQVVDVGDTVVIRVEASDPDGSVAVVRFFVDGAFLGQDDQSPFEHAWDTEDEESWEHRIQVVAVDNRGAQTARSVPAFTSWVYHVPESTDAAWETASLEEAALELDPLLTLMNRIRAHEEHLIHGIFIARHGKLVFEEYFDGYDWRDPSTLVPFDRTTLHDLASVTKSFTSALLGIAVEEGIIDSVQETVWRFFPEVAGLDEPPKDAITLEHLVNMASGLQWDQHSYPILDPRNDLILFGQSPTPWEFYLSRPMVTPPGTAMNYSEGSINVVGHL